MTQATGLQLDYGKYILQEIQISRVAAMNEPRPNSGAKVTRNQYLRTTIISNNSEQ